MPNNVRVEYLFPNIENKRKLKWLESASFALTAADHEIVDWNFETYMHQLRRERWRFQTGNQVDVTDKVNQQDYQTWQTTCHTDLYRLQVYNLRWNNEMVHALALYLAHHPLALPHFLTENAINIVGEFLGKSILFTEMVFPKHYGYHGYEFMSSKKSSETEYRRFNFEAKYQLSLFLSVIDELLDMGINLQEYRFGNIRQCNTYQELGTVPLWYQDIHQNQSYTRIDGQIFEPKEMMSFVDFKDLFEFLNRIMKLVEVEYYVDFIEEAVTLSSKKIQETPSYPLQDMSYFHSEDLVQVKTLCEEMQRKLKQVEKLTESKILNRKLEELTKAVTENNEDEVRLREMFEQLYEEILNSLSLDKKSFLERLNVLLPAKASEVSEKTSTDVEARLDDLEQRMTNVEKKVADLETALYQYLEHGGENPLKGEIPLTREEVIRIVSEYSPKSFWAQMRKQRLLKLLKLGALGAMAAGLIFLGSSKEETPTVIKSQPTIPKHVVQIKPVIKPVISEPSVVLETAVDHLKPLEEVVVEVIRGEWKNEPERSELLIAAGYDNVLVQDCVNKVLLEGVPLNQLRTTGEIVVEVMSGKWGENEELQRRLAAVGYDVAVIQALIGEEPKVEAKQYFIS